MNKSVSRYVRVVFVLVLSMIIPSFLLAQSRVAASKEELPLKIREFIGMGPQSLVDSPIYRTNAGGVTRPGGKWVQLSTSYDTYPDWIDNITFEYFVMTLKTDKDGKKYSFFSKSIKYSDVEKRTRHKSTAYLRPVAIKRFGPVVGVAMEVSVSGTLVAVKSYQSDPNLKKFEKWWKDPKVTDSPVVTRRAGYLLNRKESPFAYVNIDEYEVIK